MTTTNKYEGLQEIGKNAAASIGELVAALNCDYDRLEELRGERDDWDVSDNDGKAWADMMPDDAEELAELKDAAGDCESREEAETRIQEDALSLEFRSGWAVFRGDLVAEEFKILITTGGPAVQIIGEIDGDEPSNVRLQVQDWGTPWTDYTETIENDTLLAYCRCFCFDE